MEINNIFYIFLFFYLLNFNNGEKPPNVLTCNKTKLPQTWLWTIGHGILDIGVSGMIPDGPDYCIDFNKTSSFIQIQYHIDLFNVPSKISYIKKEEINKESNLTNSCNNQNDQIHYCFPLCVNSTLQDIATKNALLYRGAKDAAENILKDMNETKNFVVTVLKISLDKKNPAKLMQDVFFDPNYCSVYIGMQTIGYPYLYEIQIAKIYNSKKD
uniref:SAM domain-containing protein n=1 Tax=Strongyloides stercoralis TaxID=6248 RepID=A0A0K0ER39_STRER